MSSIYGYTIYCDDIRQEVGGKFSFMGVYNGSLHVLSGKPAVLSKLSAAMTVVIPEGIGVDGPIDFALTKFENGENQEIARGTADGDIFPLKPADEGKVNRVGMNFQLAPFPINSECSLRARCYVNGEEIKLGGLTISMSPPADAEPVEDAG